MVHLFLDEASCKHLSKSNWRPKYYWKYLWNFVVKTWKSHGNFMECCQSGKVRILAEQLTFSLLFVWFWTDVSARCQMTLDDT